MLESVITGGEMTFAGFLICSGTSLALGILIALFCKYKNSCTQSFLITVAMLPAVVQLIIMLVNGNIGVGVAVAGTFSLVRFRSVPGTAREIGTIFLAMAAGLATGMGYAALACLFVIVMGAFIFALTALRFGSGAQNERQLKITIPENLNYDGLFDDLFKKYTNNYKLERVRTTNMGTLYELDYRVALKDAVTPKAFLDDIRCRNGNLNIVCGRVDAGETL